jgi:uncharacterized protein YcbK (DUF882 family)
MTAATPPPDRRRLLRLGVRWAAAAGALPVLAAAPARAAAGLAAPGERVLALAHTHTGERLQLVYARADGYQPDALGALNHFLRDHYTGRVGRIDPALFDLLHRVRGLLGSTDAFEVISGYRCPETNQRLRQGRGGGVARHSLHMDGQAIDVRLRGVPLAELRDAALSLRAGGVGFYPRDQFVHIDTGRPRSW